MFDFAASVTYRLVSSDFPDDDHGTVDFDRYDADGTPHWVAARREFENRGYDVSDVDSDTLTVMVDDTVHICDICGNSKITLRRHDQTTPDDVMHYCFDCLEEAGAIS